MFKCNGDVSFFHQFVCLFDCCLYYLGLTLNIAELTRVARIAEQKVGNVFELSICTFDLFGNEFSPLRVKVSEQAIGEVLPAPNLFDFLLSKMRLAKRKSFPKQLSSVFAAAQDTSPKLLAHSEVGRNVARPVKNLAVNLHDFQTRSTINFMQHCLLCITEEHLILDMNRQNKFHEIHQLFIVEMIVSHRF